MPSRRRARLCGLKLGVRFDCCVCRISQRFSGIAVVILKVSDPASECVSLGERICVGGDSLNARHRGLEIRLNPCSLVQLPLVMIHRPFRDAFSLGHGQTCSVQHGLSVLYTLRSALPLGLRRAKTLATLVHPGKDGRPVHGRADWDKG